MRIVSLFVFKMPNVLPLLCFKADVIPQVKHVARVRVNVVVLSHTREIVSPPRCGSLRVRCENQPPLLQYSSHVTYTFAHPWSLFHSIIHTDLKPENVLLDLPPRPPPESEQPPPLQGRESRAGMAMKGVATTIEDLNMALSMADQNGLSAEEKRKLKKKVCAVDNTERMPQ